MISLLLEWCDQHTQLPKYATIAALALGTIEIEGELRMILLMTQIVATICALILTVITIRAKKSEKARYQNKRRDRRTLNERHNNETNIDDQSGGG